MSPMKFNEWQYHMSLLLIFPNVTCQILETAMSHVTIILTPCRMSLSLMSHVELKATQHAVQWSHG